MGEADRVNGDKGRREQRDKAKSPCGRIVVIRLIGIGGRSERNIFLAGVYYSWLDPPSDISTVKAAECTTSQKKD